MDPLITDGIDPALLRVLEKRGHDRDPGPRRKRPLVPENTADEEAQEQGPEPEAEDPRHALDDLA
ncbi:MAG: hypothetical protein ABSD75_30680 [Terriglobales bacterium]|jgi:hypothetical protein